MCGLVVDFVPEAGVNLKRHVLITAVSHGLDGVLKGLVAYAAGVIGPGDEMNGKARTDGFPVRGVAVLHKEKEVQETVGGEHKLAKGICVVSLQDFRV